MEGMEVALARKEQKNRYRKVTGDVKAWICAIVYSEPSEGASRWTMQAVANGTDPQGSGQLYYRQYRLRGYEKMGSGRGL